MVRSTKYRASFTSGTLFRFTPESRLRCSLTYSSVSYRTPHTRSAVTPFSLILHCRYSTKNCSARLHLEYCLIMTDTLPITSLSHLALVHSIALRYSVMTDFVLIHSKFLPARERTNNRELRLHSDTITHKNYQVLYAKPYWTVSYRQAGKIVR